MTYALIGLLFVVVFIAGFVLGVTAVLGYMADAFDRLERR